MLDDDVSLPLLLLLVHAVLLLVVVLLLSESDALLMLLLPLDGARRCGARCLPSATPLFFALLLGFTFFLLLLLPSFCCCCCCCCCWPSLLVCEASSANSGLGAWREACLLAAAI